MILPTVLTTLGSWASLVGAIYALQGGRPLGFTQLGLIGLGTTLTMVALYFQITEYVAHRPIILKTAQQIRDYMFRWISRGGRVAIFSRDMSWVEDDEMKDLLRAKARRDELHICLPTRILLSDDLQKEGAHIHVYPQLNYTPLSRFTIINKGRSDAQLAVGRAIEGKHLIEEFSLGEHPAFFIADDLIEVVMRLGQTVRTAAR